MQTLNHSDLRTTPFWGRTERGHLQQYGPPLEETYRMFLVRLKLMFELNLQDGSTKLRVSFGLALGAEDYDRDQS